MQNPKIDKDGTKRWWVNGKRHRLDGPAVEFANGDKYWYVNGRRHRLDGPAIERPNSYKAWYVNDKRHRLDGPAIETSGGHKAWYANDKHLSGPLGLLEHGANLSDIAEYLTPREIAQIKLDK